MWFIIEPRREKACLWVTDQVRHKLGCTQKMVIGLKFRIYELEGVYNLYSENKGADQLYKGCSDLVSHNDVVDQNFWHATLKLCMLVWNFFEIVGIRKVKLV